jgi:(E)-4-hydroxy-3-methylbut-2-enyl-diphosphate synthase
MGCAVNGPGEAREADIAVCGGDGKYALYVRGGHVRTLPEAGALEAIAALVETWGTGQPIHGLMPG